MTYFQIKLTMMLQWLQPVCLMVLLSGVSTILEGQTGNAAIQEYARYFNTHPNQPCITSNWTCIGPFGRPANIKDCRGCAPNHSGTGQMHQIRFSPNYGNDNTVYACSTYGGLWVSTDRGDHWSALNTDTQIPFSCVSDIAINPVNTKVLYIATGESQRTSGHFSLKQDGSTSAFTPLFTAGVFRSTDGGAHWQNINGKNQQLLGFFSNGGFIRKILVHPADPQKLIIAGSEGVFQTENAMADEPVWEKLTTNISDEELIGLEFHPAEPHTIFTSGRDIYRSGDGGKSWSSLTGAGTGLDLQSLPDSFTVGRINIAVTPANPSKLFAYIAGSSPKCSSGKIFIFEFNGHVWQEKYQLCAVSAFDALSLARLALVVSPENESELYFGHTMVRGIKNVNSSRIIPAVSPYYENGRFHADVFSLAIEPGGKFLFAATDGGIHKKDMNAPGQTGWTDISTGLAVSTPYRFDDTDDRTDRIMMGTQDCGTFIFTHENGWENIYGGDGYNGKIDGVSGLAFGTSSGAKGLLVYDFNKKQLQIENARTTYPTDAQPGQGIAWIRGTYAMKNHPVTEKMYFSMTEIYERQIAKPSGKISAEMLWKRKSDVGKVTPEQWQRQLQIFDIAESNPDWMYVAQNGGVWDHPKDGFSIEPRLFRSKSGGCNAPADTACFEDITGSLINSGIRNRIYLPVNSAPPVKIPTITGILFHPENHLKAWITFSGYEPGMHVWQTIDGGETWTNADPDNSLHNLPVNDLVFQRGSNERLYIGTDAGIYFKDAAMKNWEKFCDFPNVRVTELKINYCMGKLRAATFGRSVWEGDLLPGDGTLGKSELVISTTPETPWNFSRGLDRNLRIKSGATLTIEGTPEAKVIISMPKDGKIVIERGARLVLNNAEITNNCGQKWLGIEKEGGFLKRMLRLLN